MLDTNDLRILKELVDAKQPNDDAMNTTRRRVNAMYNIARSERNPQSFEEALWLLAMQRNALMVRKNKDYGKTNVSKFGLTGILVRASDKLERLITLTQAGREGANDESIADTLADLANYGAIGQMLRHEWWLLPYEEDVK